MCLSQSFYFIVLLYEKNIKTSNCVLLACGGITCPVPVEYAVAAFEIQQSSVIQYLFDNVSSVQAEAVS